MGSYDVLYNQPSKTPNRKVKVGLWVGTIIFVVQLLAPLVGFDLEVDAQIVDLAEKAAPLVPIVFSYFTKERAKAPTPTAGAYTPPV